MFQHVDIITLVDGCLDRFREVFILENIEVERMIPVQEVRVLGNRFGLEHVFYNVILKAVDAMDGRCNKKMKATVTPLEDLSSVEVTFSDTGWGVREDLLIEIFATYFTDKRNGNAFGLGIVKDVVENHGGKVLVESRLGVGSTFIIHLPVMQMN